MNVTDLSGVVEEKEAPVCPICGYSIFIDETVAIARAGNIVFLAHYACSDIEFFDA